MLSLPLCRRRARALMAVDFLCYRKAAMQGLVPPSFLLPLKQQKELLVITCTSTPPSNGESRLSFRTSIGQGSTLECQYIFSNDYEYANPVANPPVFQDFTPSPHIADTTHLTNLPGLALELNASKSGGFRETYTALHRSPRRAPKPYRSYKLP